MRSAAFALGLLTTGCGAEAVTPCSTDEPVRLRVDVGFEARGAAGPATLSGEGPYTLAFDHGPSYSVNQVARPLPNGRGYVHLEVKWYGPIVPSFRLSQWALDEAGGRGALLGVLWNGASMLDGDFGEVAYSVQGTEDTFERCANTVERHDLVVRAGDDAVRLSEDSSAAVGGFCARHEVTTVFTTNGVRCPETPADYSAGRIVRLETE